MSEIKKTSGTKLKQVKELVEYMRSVGVDAFKVGDIEVTFGMSASQSREAVAPIVTPEDREAELDRIKERMKQMAASADEDLFWSSPSS